MKIIHTADLHLGSALTSIKDKQKILIRRKELSLVFMRIAEYAAKVSASAVIIAGDLFDTPFVSEEIKILFLSVVDKHPSIHFFYLLGNHDMKIKLDNRDRHNLHIFSDRFETYRLGKVEISGAVINKTTNEDIYDELSVDEEMINIVTLHGNIIPGEVRGAEDIPLSLLKNRGIDYLALGHMHSYRKERLDERGIICYAGCPEPRGFDETGEKGFVVLDIDEDRHLIKDKFVKFARRTVVDLNIDISGADDSYLALRTIRNKLEEKNVSNEDSLKIKLVGLISEEVNINEALIENALMTDYFTVDITSELKTVIDYEKYRYDQSLKGEFIRKVLNGTKNKDEASEIIRYGLMALRGEELYEE